MELYNLEPKGFSMTHISIQNALQNHYLGAEDRYISAAEGTKDETTVQNTDLSLHQLEDRTLTQSINRASHHTEDRTTAQYADSAIYDLADRTTAQLYAPIPDRSDDRTICQKPTLHVQQEAILLAASKNSIQGRQIQHNIFRMKESFSIGFAQLAEQFLSSIRRITDFKRGSNPTRQFATASVLKALPSPHQNNRPLLNRIEVEVQPSVEEYQKALRELDHCRLAFAQELARNGKFRDAIALTNKISTTSRFFQDAQTLTRSWKQL